MPNPQTLLNRSLHGLLCFFPSNDLNYVVITIGCFHCETDCFSHRLNLLPSPCFGCRENRPAVAAWYRHTWCLVLAAGPGAWAHLGHEVNMQAVPQPCCCCGQGTAWALQACLLLPSPCFTPDARCRGSLHVVRSSHN